MGTLPKSATLCHSQRWPGRLIPAPQNSVLSALGTGMPDARWAVPERTVLGSAI